MPRPRKRRMVCCLPDNNLFGPLNGQNLGKIPVIMSIDEYEIIRLIDFEGLSQSECAERMRVARATIQNSYQKARHKLAQAITSGSPLQIEGGDFRLYDDNQRDLYGCGKHQRNRFGRRGLK